jgi:hypothetical protein
VGDALYQAVAAAIDRGDPGVNIRRLFTLHYKIFKDIAESILGVAGYKEWSDQRKSLIGQRNIQEAHRKYARLSPEEKAAYFQQYRGTCKLERLLADQLEGLGFRLSLNQWQSIPIHGMMVPREADIKVSVDDVRKIVVMCDGEAFHGPLAVFADPGVRVQDDVTTADAYFHLGYSVLRYSESEIKTGVAVDHFKKIYERLQSDTVRVYRTWHPKVERLVA